MVPTSDPESGTSTPDQGNIKERAALITLSLNTLLTVLKFVLFYFTGSLAVLAEAWHSFSDIATSFLVFLAVRPRNGGAAATAGAGPQNETGQGGDSGNDGGDATDGDVITDGNGATKSLITRTTSEQWASLAIGLFLSVVALFLLYKFFDFTPVVVKYPLVAGLVFLGFSLGSYLVYRFESSVGKAAKSVGLQSDGMHARTDMIASLLAGFSLILYHLGLDIDRWVAGLIALIVLSFAIETLVNVVLSIVRGESEVLFRHKTLTLVAKALAPSNLARSGEFLAKHVKIPFLHSSLVRRLPQLILIAGILGLLGWWGSTSIFQVGPSEQAIVERFGRPLQTDEPLGPGMHFKAPWPVDNARVLDTESIRSMNIGNQQLDNTFALLWTRKHGTEIPFLSGDNNYFYPYLVLHYRVRNLHDFIYRHGDAEELLQETAHQLAVKRFATKAFYEIALDYRGPLVTDLITGIQDVMDRLETGIELTGISVKDIHPPIIVADAYEMVIASLQEKERVINDALGYRNQNLPEARGDAIAVRKEAEGFALDLPLRAEGDGEYFLSRIPRQPGVRKITELRLYLAAMAEALVGRRKVLVDPKAGVLEIWLNTKNLLGNPGLDMKTGQF